MSNSLKQGNTSAVELNTMALFDYFYADLYCYANATVTYPISVLLTGTSWSQQSL